MKSNQLPKPAYILGITGATGMAYTKRLLQVVAPNPIRLHIVSSTPGEAVTAHETGHTIEQLVASVTDKHTKAEFIIEDNADFFSRIASGSYPIEGMVILPCTISTVGHIANGVLNSLLHRAAAVCIKEKCKLIVALRESPLSSIDLQNLLTLSNNGVTVMPLSPGFYNNPQTVDDLVDFMVARIAQSLGIANNIFRVWGESPA